MTADSPEQSQEETLSDEALEGGAAAPTPILDGGREAELEAELAKLKDQLLRAMAETENVRRRLEAAGETLPVKVWLFPVVSVVAALSIIAVLVMMLLSPDEFSEVALSTGVFVLCVVAWQIRARLGGPVAVLAA